MFWALRLSLLVFCPVSRYETGVSAACTPSHALVTGSKVDSVATMPSTPTVSPVTSIDAPLGLAQPAITAQGTLAHNAANFPAEHPIPIFSRSWVRKDNLRVLPS
ncbi:hypothetical protein H2248_011359 [Termitomyces sp. 'cryptogamus']|nr:hypothetical protein H2248_011359 [Termitomyces sp. 'cryptogamus']